MLILTRKLGERTRIITPCGCTVWVTMEKGYMSVDTCDGEQVVEADYEHPRVYLDYGGDTIEIVYNPESRKFTGQKIGITAPITYVVLREELIDKPQHHKTEDKTDEITIDGNTAIPDYSI